MSEGFIATKANVTIFLKELKSILESPEAKIDIELRRDKQEEYSTEYCLRDLEFDTKDVIEELKKLKLSEYVECCPDMRNPKSRDYYVFSRIYNQKQVYIKIKIKSYDNKIILCKSFHYAEYETTRFPYRGKEVE